MTTFAGDKDEAEGSFKNAVEKYPSGLVEATELTVANMELKRLGVARPKAACRAAKPATRSRPTRSEGNVDLGNFGPRSLQDNLKQQWITSLRDDDMVKALPAAACCALVLTCSTLAADMDVVRSSIAEALVAPVPFTWTGVYMGLNVATGVRHCITEHVWFWMGIIFPAPTIIGEQACGL